MNHHRHPILSLSQDFHVPTRLKALWAFLLPCAANHLVPFVIRSIGFPIVVKDLTC